MLLFGTTLTSKNVCGTLIVLYLFLNMFFVRFSSILTWKYFKHTYVVAVSTLNAPSTLSSVFITAKNVAFTFHDVLLPSKRQQYLFLFFETSNYFGRCLVCCLLGSKYISSSAFCSLSFLHHRYLSCFILTTKSFIGSFLLFFWTVLTFFTAYIEVFKRYIHTL